jgi:hypothetical protein
MNTDEFIIKRVKRGWIVARGERHSHFKCLQGCKSCIAFIESDTRPSNPYYYTAVKRLLDDDEMSCLNSKRVKQKYVNNKRGVM